MRVLVTGASGLLGRAVLHELVSANIESLGLCFSRQGPGLRKCDLTNDEQLASVMKEFQPNVVIHCAAERRPDVVEKKAEQTKAINVDATARVCHLAASSGAQVIFISTDYVFDGLSPPYAVTDEPKPLNAYGKSKLAGEKVVLKGKGNVVLRVPVLYGPVQQLSESAVTVLFSKVKDSANPAPMNATDKRYPTHVNDVGKVLVAYLRLPEERRPVGVLHWSGNEMFTKLDMALAMAEAFNLPFGHIIAESGPSGGAVRPPDAHLDRSVLENLGCVFDRSFRVAVAESLAPFLS